MGHCDECVEEKTSNRGLLRIFPVNWTETNAVRVLFTYCFKKVVSLRHICFLSKFGVYPRKWRMLSQSSASLLNKVNSSRVSVQGPTYPSLDKLGSASLYSSSEFLNYFSAIDGSPIRNH